MSDRRFIAEDRRRVPAAELPPPTAAAPHERLLALARGAGNAAMARMLSPARDRTLMRTHSAAGDLATVDDVVDLLEDRVPPPRARSASAPPAFASPTLVPPPAVEEAQDVPSEPSPVEAEPEEPVSSPVAAAAETVEPVSSPAAAVPSAAGPEPESEPVVVAVPTPSPPKQPRIPKNPQPLPTHPTIGDNLEAFNVQAHAQFVRDELALASQAADANKQVLSNRLSEVDLIARGKSTDPLDVQRAKITAADQACQPLRNALQQRLKTALEDAIKPGNTAYVRIRNLETKARSLVARYEWPILVTTLESLESASKTAEQLDTLAAKATKSVAHLKGDAQIDELPQFARYEQRQRLTQIETLVAGRHAATNLTQRLKDLSETLKKAETDYTDVALWGKVQTAVGSPTQGTKQAARDALKTLLEKGVVRRGKIESKYRDTSKGPGFFGVEWSLEGTDRIVVHSHINSDGKANDDEATHFKLRGTKLLGGTSVGMPAGWKGDKLMDPEVNKATPCPYPPA